MPSSSSSPPFYAVPALLRTLGINNRISLYLLENLASETWRAPTPDGKGRDIAGIFAHMHNVRIMWLAAAAKDTSTPPKADPQTLTMAQAKTLLKESHAALEGLISASLESDGRIRNFKPDAAAFVGYLIAHDAHHRGQASMLARLAGHPLDKKANFGMWEWGVR